MKTTELPRLREKLGRHCYALGLLMGVIIHLKRNLKFVAPTMDTKLRKKNLSTRGYHGMMKRMNIAK